MKKTSFNDLSLELRTSIVDEFASPLLSIEYYDYRADLFSLNSLLIERYQNIETEEVERIFVAEYADLDKYLSQIMIGRLKKSLEENH